MKKDSNGIPNKTMGIDLGDRRSHWCMIDGRGEVVGRGVVTTSRAGFSKEFERMPKARVVIENGTHARWVWRLFADWGHEVIVANTHKVKLISNNDRKHDRIDAEYLARLGRVDPKLLWPIRFRGEQAHVDRSVLKARDGLVRARSMLINEVRGMVKSQGARICDHSAESFARKAAEQIPEPLLEAVKPVLASIEQLSEKIGSYDQQIEQISKQRYPETALLQQVTGVGPITGLAFLTTLEDANRFSKSRHVGPYLGLTPKRDQSGDHDAQLRITKAGDGYLRKLLVNGAQYILGPFGPDCDLRRHGLKIAARGGKNAKKRAVVAVARKLAVLLHHLWVTGECYEPLYNTHGKSFSSGAAMMAPAAATVNPPAAGASQRYAPAGDRRNSWRN